MADRTLAGVGLMLGFVGTAPLIDVFSKLAAATLPVGEVTAARFLVQGLVMLPAVAWLGGPLRVPRGTAALLLLRAGMLGLSTFSFVSAIDVMPLADALAIVFVMPFLLLLMGWLGGDAVGARRLLACAVGFAGCLMVIKPSLDGYGLVALWPLGTAASFAVYMVVTRRLAGRMGDAAMQLHTSWMALALCLPLLALGGALGVEALGVLRPEGWAWAWLAGTGAASAVAHMMMTTALRHAPAATLAPLNYLEIVSAVFWGFAVWGDWPDAVTGLGIAVIVGSGMYVIHRERLASAARGASLTPGAGAPGAAG